MFLLFPTFCYWPSLATFLVVFLLFCYFSVTDMRISCHLFPLLQTHTGLHGRVPSYQLDACVLHRLLLLTIFPAAHLLDRSFQLTFTDRCLVLFISLLFCRSIYKAEFSRPLNGCWCTGSVCSFYHFFCGRRVSKCEDDRFPFGPCALVSISVRRCSVG